MVTARRRHREVQKTRSLLRAETGHEPTAREVIEATNARLAHLKNAAYQGMNITADDLQLPAQAPDPELAMDTEAHVDFAEDCILHPAEGKQIVADTIETCHRHDETTGKAASLWMGDVYLGSVIPEGTDTITHIAKTLSIPRQAVFAHIAQVRRIAIGLLADLVIEGLSA